MLYTVSGGSHMYICIYWLNYLLFINYIHIQINILIFSFTLSKWCLLNKSKNLQNRTEIFRGYVSVVMKFRNKYTEKYQQEKKHSIQKR